MRRVFLLLNIIILFLFLTNGFYEYTAYGDRKSDVYELGNRHIKLRYDPGNNAFVITNRNNRRVYHTEPVDSFKTTGVKILSSTRMDITCRLGKGGSEIAVLIEITLEDKRVKGVIKAAKDASLVKPIAFPGAFRGDEKKQYFAIPYAEGILVPAAEKYDFGEYQMWRHKSTMPFVGMTDLKTGIMITSDTPWDAAIQFTKESSSKNGDYLMTLKHYPAKGKLGYDRVFYIDLIDRDGYNEMAKVFRKHLQDRQASKGPDDNNVLVTLKEKLQKNGNVDKLIGAVDFWLGSTAMKDAGIIDDLISNGVKKAVINFQYGWKVYEDEKRPQVVGYVADSGMISSRYDNFTCVYDTKAEKISPRYRTDGFDKHVIVKQDGRLQEGHREYYKGHTVQGYRLNTKYSLEDVDPFITKDLAENRYLGRFVDVVVSAGLYEDYSKVHPMTRQPLRRKNRR